MWSLVVAAGVLAVVSCSGGRDHTLTGQGGSAGKAGEAGTAGDDGGTVLPSKCTDGETRKCKIELGTVTGITNCAEGVYLCVDGHWTTCIEPDAGVAGAAGAAGTAGAAGSP